MVRRGRIEGGGARWMFIWLRSDPRSAPPGLRPAQSGRPGRSGRHKKYQGADLKIFLLQEKGLQRRDLPTHLYSLTVSKGVSQCRLGPTSLTDLFFSKIPVVWCVRPLLTTGDNSWYPVYIRPWYSVDILDIRLWDSVKTWLFSAIFQSILLFDHCSLISG